MIASCSGDRPLGVSLCHPDCILLLKLKLPLSFSLCICGSNILEHLLGVPECHMEYQFRQLYKSRFFRLDLTSIRASNDQSA